MGLIIMGIRSVEVSGHRNILLEVDGVRKYMKEKGVPKEEARDRRTRIIKTIDSLKRNMEKAE